MQTLKEPKNARVLLVDDDQDYYLMTKRMLSKGRRYTYSIDWVSEYTQAIKKIFSGNYDVCLLDYTLGGEKDGIEFLKEVIAQGYTRPVIMLTCHNDVNIDNYALDSGAADYLLKEQLDAETLERSIRYSLKHYRLVNELILRKVELRGSLAETDALTQELRRLATRLLKVQEEERTRISRDIHDQLGQSLTVLKMQVYDLQDDFLRKSEGENCNRLAKISAAIDELIVSVRTVASEMRPTILQDFGLEEAIRQAVAEYNNRTRIACSLSVDLQNRKIDLERSTAIYRILQEALTNVARHSGSPAVDIAITCNVECIELKVTDFGKGCAGEIKPGNTLGLIGMRERALGLQGTFAMRNNIECGSTVHAVIPISTTRVKND